MKYYSKEDAQNYIDTIFCEFLDVLCHLTQRIINTLQTFRIKKWGCFNNEILQKHSPDD